MHTMHCIFQGPPTKSESETNTEQGTVKKFLTFSQKFSKKIYCKKNSARKEKKMEKNISKFLGKSQNIFSHD